MKGKLASKISACNLKQRRPKGPRSNAQLEQLEKIILSTVLYVCVRPEHLAFDQMWNTADIG